ncbi:MAG: hypothetical protein VX265_16600 [Myxococcota bacterium]|nr:hypothetical protein [Myxococcota bacterium]
MALRPGETLFERFEVHTVAPAHHGLIQARARDRTSGRWLQLVAPDRTARLRPAARQRFAAATAAPTAPAILPRTDVGDLDGVPLAMREDGVRPFPSGARMSARDAWHALRWLAPAVQVAAGALGGELDTRDLALDSQGRLLLAPSGIVRAESLSTLPHHRPPEAWEGPSPTAAAALYGLGVWLFQVVAGETPVAASGRGELQDGQARPRGLRTLVPEIPEELADAIDALVSPIPSRRLAALADLPAADPARPSLSMPAVADLSRPAHAAPAAPHPSEAADRALLGWLVVADTSTTTQAARRRLAALAGMDPRVLEDAHAQGEPVPLLEGLRNEASARAALAPLEAAGVPLRPQLAPDSPTGRRVAAAGLGGAGLLGLLLGLALLPLGLPYALMAILPATALVVGALFLAVSAQRDVALLSRLSSAARRRDAANGLGPAQARLAAARRAVLAPHVPDAVRVDLDEALDQLQDALENSPESAGAEVEAAALRVEQAVVSGADSTDLRARLDDAERRACAAAAALRGGS